MRGRMVAVFVAGVLCCALFMGAMIGTFNALSGDAQAQEGNTWQREELFNPLIPGDTYRLLSEWIEELPANCDFQIIELEKVADKFEAYDVFYRCPAS